MLITVTCISGKIGENEKVNKDIERERFQELTPKESLDLILAILMVFFGPS